MSTNNKYRGTKERAPLSQKPLVVKIISEHKKRTGRSENVKYTSAPKGMRRVMALVRIPGMIGEFTRHVNVPIT